jgi:predicted Zn-dependent peptidase
MTNRSIPSISPAGHLTIHEPRTVRLDCGVPLYVFHQDDMEVFGLDVIYPKASLFAQAPNTLYQNFTSSMVFAGTEKKSSFEINNELDFYGAYVSSESHLYHSEISLYGLQMHFESGARTFFDSLANFSIPQDELGVLVKKEISSHRIALQKTSFLCKRLFGKHVWGEEHPSGQMIGESDYGVLSREGLLQFKRDYFCSPEIYFAGNFTDDILRNINDLFQIGEDSGLARPELIEPDPLPVGLYFEKKTGALQASLRMGRWMPDRLHPDYPAIFLTAIILGGYFGSRLMKNIREEKGLTYGISARINPVINGSLLIIQSDCRNDSVTLVMDEINKELDTLGTTPVSVNELDAARNYLLGVLIRGYDGLFEQKERCVSRHVHGIEINSILSLFENLKLLNPDNILEAAHNYFNKNSLTAVWSGDQS